MTFGHVGSIVFGVLLAVVGVLLAVVAVWTLWRERVRPGRLMPTVAAALVVSLASTPIARATSSSMLQRT